MSVVGGYMVKCDCCGLEKFIPYGKSRDEWNRLILYGLGNDPDPEKGYALCKDCSEQIVRTINLLKKGKVLGGWGHGDKGID